MSGISIFQSSLVVTLHHITASRARPPAERGPLQSEAPCRARPPAERGPQQSEAPSRARPPAERGPQQSEAPSRARPPAERGPQQSEAPSRARPPAERGPLQSEAPSRARPPAERGPLQSEAPSRARPPAERGPQQSGRSCPHRSHRNRVRKHHERPKYLVNSGKVWDSGHRAEFLEMKNAPENASCLPQPDPDHFLCLESGRGSACCYLSCRRGVDTNSFFFLCSVPRVETRCPQPHSTPALRYTTSCEDLPLRRAGWLSRWAGGTAVEGRG
ncbi:unnamed protein product [Arctogadus glacialis]